MATPGIEQMPTFRPEECYGQRSRGGITKDLATITVNSGRRIYRDNGQATFFGSFQNHPRRTANVPSQARPKKRVYN